VRAHTLSARDLSLLAKGYASMLRIDQSLYWHLAAVAQQLPFEVFVYAH
jgi:hypothetical protein